MECFSSNLCFFSVNANCAAAQGQHWGCFLCSAPPGSAFIAVCALVLKASWHRNESRSTGAIRAFARG